MTRCPFQSNRLRGVKMYIVMLILDDPSKLYEVLDAWDEIGISGATIMDSTGRNRLRKAQQVGTLFMAGTAGSV